MPLGHVDTAQSAIEFIVLTCYTLRSTPCSCGLAQGSRLVNFFENTRDRGHHHLTHSPRAFQKSFQSNHPTLSARNIVSIQNSLILMEGNYELAHINYKNC
jgi:hypothetical protein